MSVKITQPIPPNVVEIGNEISQGVIDGLMSASPSPSSANPYLTVNGANFLKLTGGTIVGNVTISDGVIDAGNTGERINITPSSIYLSNDIGDANHTFIGRGGIGFHDDASGSNASFNANGYSFAAGSFDGDTGLTVGVIGITFPDSSVQTTAAVSPDLSNYLTKAGNLSGLASTSTARTNLGLAYATDAQSVAGTSASVVISPSTANNLDIHPQTFVLNSTNFSSASSGNGSAIGQEFGFQLATGTSANSYAIRKVSPSQQVAVTRGSNVGVWDFSKRIQLSGNCIYSSVQANVNVRATLGKSTSDNNGDLVRLGMGFKQSGTNPLQVHCHNGTTATTSTNSTFTPSANVAFDWKVVSDGAGNATLFVNDAQVASTTGGPTAITTNTANFVQYEIDCSANLATQSIASIGNPKIFQGR